MTVEEKALEFFLPLGIYLLDFAVKKSKHHVIAVRSETDEARVSDNSAPGRAYILGDNDAEKL